MSSLPALFRPLTFRLSCFLCSPFRPPARLSALAVPSCLAPSPSSIHGACFPVPPALPFTVCAFPVAACCLASLGFVFCCSYSLHPFLLCAHPSLWGRGPLSPLFVCSRLGVFNCAIFLFLHLAGFSACPCAWSCFAPGFWFRVQLDPFPPTWGSVVTCHPGFCPLRVVLFSCPVGWLNRCGSF